jgi:hypothetical protein
MHIITMRAPRARAEHDHSLDAAQDERGTSRRRQGFHKK